MTLSFEKMTEMVTDMYARKLLDEVLHHESPLMVHWEPEPMTAWQRRMARVRRWRSELPRRLGLAWKALRGVDLREDWDQ